MRGKGALLNLAFFFSGGILFLVYMKLLSSFRLLRKAHAEANLGLQMINFLSQRHKLQRFEAGLYGVPCFNIFRVKLNFDFQIPHVFALLGARLFV